LTEGLQQFGTTRKQDYATILALLGQAEQSFTALNKDGPIPAVLNKQLKKALTELDFATADKALHDGAQCNHKFFHFSQDYTSTVVIARSLLSHYVKNKDIVRISYLLENGANPFSAFLSKSDHNKMSAIELSTLSTARVNSHIYDMLSCWELEWKNAQCQALYECVRTKNLCMEIVVAIASKISPELKIFFTKCTLDDEDNILLIKAVQQKLYGLIPLLLEFGEDVLAKSKNGETALNIVKKQASDFKYIHQTSYRPLLLLTRREVVRLQHITDQAIYQQHRELIGKLFPDMLSGQQKSHNPVAPTPAQQRLQNSYALFDAVKTSNIPFLESLINRGANVNSRHDNGMSLLAYAIPYHNVTIIEMLLARGANPNYIIPISKVSPLMMAAQSSTSDTYALVNLLLSKGSDCLASDYLGQRSSAYCQLSPVELMLQEKEAQELKLAQSRRLSASSCSVL
jgi:hypothetical protein